MQQALAARPRPAAFLLGALSLLGLTLMTDVVSAGPPRRPSQPAPPWPLRPAVGFLHPLDVVKDPDLDLTAKRQILASWASDASAVEGRPSHRWLLGTHAPIHIAEIQDALRVLERKRARLELS